MTLMERDHSAEIGESGAVLELLICTATVRIWEISIVTKSSPSVSEKDFLPLIHLLPLSILNDRLPL
jgi:hypothetical protein